MKHFVPYEKLSKKEKRKLDAAKRGSWNGVNPVTRQIKSKLLYTRKRKHKNAEDSESSQ